MSIIYYLLHKPIYTFFFYKFYDHPSKHLLSLPFSTLVTSYSLSLSHLYLFNVEATSLGMVKYIQPALSYSCPE